MDRSFSFSLSVLFLFSGLFLNAQTTRKVLFLGNSYTGVNNLPQMVKDMALSVGDTLIFESNTPGGYQFEDHYSDAVSTAKIAKGGWDYIVLQEQSQRPITNSSKFNNYGIGLNNLFFNDNNCGVAMLYMTWGRKNGDASNCASFPVMCTYEGMDSTLRNNYLELASRIEAEVSPVGVVWNYLRNNHPGIELYQTDESHPSLAGTYAAASCFYAALFKKDPTTITFNPGLSSADAALIRNAAKTEVFDQLPLWDHKQLPTSHFWFETGAGVNNVVFIHINFTETYLWDFGDGSTSTLRSPQHAYASNGTYKVSLTTTNCDLQGVHTSTYDTTIQFCSHTPTVFTSNPWICRQDTLWTQPANAYQWFQSSKPLPETKQYLFPTQQYGGSNFSVVTTVSGCSELSEPFNLIPEYSGYYFDLVGGDPCIGDTIPFAVLHINGTLPGSESILWYKDGQLLPAFTNEDTLWVTEGGAYECKVVNPNAICPLDTTSYFHEFSCATGIEVHNQRALWSVFPNPATETIRLKFLRKVVFEELKIYSAMGRLVKVAEVSANTRLDISDLPRGLYFIRLTSDDRTVQKFIKQ
jgi:hypothetical protein